MGIETSEKQEYALVLIGTYKNYVASIIAISGARSVVYVKIRNYTKIYRINEVEIITRGTHPEFFI
jgi:hypothetical protein